jgi:K+-transporting ATPase ATPase B chain
MGASLGFDSQAAEGLEFSARTRMSGTDLPDGGEVRKGAVDATAILNMVKRCSGLGKGSIVMTSERAKRARAVASTRVV